MQMGCGLMNRQGIGWFKLDLVTYPDNACFLDAILNRNTYITRCIKKEEVAHVIAESKDVVCSEIERNIIEKASVDRTEVIKIEL